MNYKTYIFISILLVGGIVVSGGISEKIKFEDRHTLFNMEKLLTLLEKPFSILLSLLYLLLFIFGVISVFVLLVKKIKKERFFETLSQLDLHVDEVLNWRVLVGVLFSIFIINFIGMTSQLNLTSREAILSSAVLYNFILEIMPLVIILKSFSKDRLGLTTQGFCPHKLLIVYSAMLLILVPSALLNNLILKKLNIESEISPAVIIFLSIKNKPLTYLLLLQIMIVGPIAEELFFRGFIFRWLRSKLSFRISAFWISFIFATLHQTAVHFLPLFLLSFLLCLVYERTHNLYNSIFLHSLHNSLGALLLLALKV
jgi:hypothetical protein